jgi:hypothetical protein
MGDLETPKTLPSRVARAAILLSFGAVFVAERDLRNRSADQVRGPKLVWRIGSTNAVVALAYLRWGRR